MNWTAPIWKKICISLIFFLLIRYLLSYIVLSSFFSVKIEAKFDHPDVVGVYFASSETTFQERHSAHSTAFSKGIREKKQIDLGDGVARKIRIDLGERGGRVKLYGISLRSHFGQEVVFNYRQIYENFKPANGIQSFSLKDDHLLIVTEGADPYIMLKGELKKESFSVSTILPFIYATVVFLLLFRASFSSMPALADLEGKTSSIGVHLGVLDGVRGLAALMVLAEHTGVLKGIGSMGVWLFFCLSGFLLSAPFIKDPARAISPDFMTTYLVRRLKRILPMYYTFLAATFMFTGKTDQFIRHILFLQADDHLWTLPQEMCFYLILPFVVAFIYLAFRGSRICAILFLLALQLLANKYLTARVITLYGYHDQLVPMVGIFLAGMMFSYLYHWLGDNRFFLRLDRTRVRSFCSVTGLILLVVLVILSARLIPGITRFNAIHNFGIFGFFAGLFILLTVLANNTLLSRIMSFYPLRAVGLVGFSFYLLHPILITFIKFEDLDFFNINLRGLPMFFLAGVATYLFAAFTYTYIERPFLQSSAAKSSPANRHCSEKMTASSPGERPSS